jgi:hypothetical protein
MVIDGFTTLGIQRWHVRTCGSPLEARTWFNGEAEAWRAECCARWARARSSASAVSGVSFGPARQE